MYMILTVYIITEVFEWWSIEKAERSWFLVNKSKDPYNIGNSRRRANLFTYLLSIVLGSIIIWLSFLYVTNIIYFIFVVLVLFYFKSKLADYFHIAYMKLEQNAKSKKVTKDLNSMKQQVFSPDSNKANSVIKDHYNQPNKKK